MTGGLLLTNDACGATWLATPEEITRILRRHLGATWCTYGLDGCMRAGLESPEVEYMARRNEAVDGRSCDVTHRSHPLFDIG